jgi:hypothetical protein
MTHNKNMFSIAKMHITLAINTDGMVPHEQECVHPALHGRARQLGTKTTPTKLWNRRQSAAAQLGGAR